MKKICMGLILIFGWVNVYAEEILELSHIELSHKVYYTHLCKRFIDCGDHPGIAEWASYARIKDVDSCIAMLTKENNSEKWKSLFSEKLISFSPKGESACMEEISSLSCSTIADGIKKPSANKGCEAYIIGTVELGAECTDHMECKSVGAICAGTCMHPPQLECGKEICTPDQTCDVKALQCITPREVGQECSNFSECLTSNCEDEVCVQGTTVSKPGGSCLENYICPLGEECQEGVCIAF